MRSFFVSSAGSSFAWNKKTWRLAEMNISKTRFKSLML